MNIGLNLLGPLAWPLFACSVVTMILIVERLVYFSMLARLMATRLRFLDHEIQTKRWDAVAERLSHWQGIPAKGIQLLLAHQGQSYAVRQDILRLWFAQQRRRRFIHIRCLKILAAASVLLSFLGLALGVTEPFHDLASPANPVQSAALTPSMQQAMLTVAVGLCIAIPALIADRAFRAWTETYLALLENLLNRINSALDDLSVAPVQDRAMPHSVGNTA